ncbi:hypothetical protein [Halorussus halophilus]|uniref:hypothetical protein n=1 Tax=Halorussus halophilus TaxID=2650975 RepID=UPI00130118F3|nr:hypothetical protein [Halorussus halophilus]
MTDSLSESKSQSDSPTDTAEVLDTLTDRGEFEIDVNPPDAEIASDAVRVETPAGWLAFEMPVMENYGAEHDRHDPDAGVYVDMWFVEGYTVVHVRTKMDGESTHTVEVHEQRPAERAMELKAHGVPERRAEIVVLREQGLSYSEIVEETGTHGPNHRGDVSTHLQKFNRQLADARWLAENASKVRVGRSGGT